MVLAWMIFSSAGMTIARYFKSEWSDKTILGQKIWFHVYLLHFYTLCDISKLNVLKFRKKTPQFHIIKVFTIGASGLYGYGVGVDCDFLFHYYPVGRGIKRCKISSVPKAI